MQFGFKQHHSTVMCSLLYHEVIYQYLCNGSNVYSCVLDASKAFDKVHYGTMFIMLLNNKSSILHYKITDGWLCETGSKRDMEFLSFHIFPIKEQGKTGRDVLSNPI